MTKLDYTLMPEEFNDVILVLENGAKKYERNGWEKGIKFEKEANIASIKRHLSEYRTGKLKDDESGLHPLLHVATRALMQYTVDKRAAEFERTRMKGYPSINGVDGQTLYERAKELEKSPDSIINDTARHGDNGYIDHPLGWSKDHNWLTLAQATELQKNEKQQNAYKSVQLSSEHRTWKGD